MSIDVVLTVTGPDRVGIVEEVTQFLLDARGNVGTSRMARLGGEFAILMLATLPADAGGSARDAAASLEAAFAPLASQGYRVSVIPTACDSGPECATWPTYRIEVVGADHEGIVNEIVSGLSRSGITIESMETGTTDAPNTGALLFTMSAVVAVPPQLDEAVWRSDLETAAEASNVDAEVYPL
jgi:glycine cleavage system transcriptional repressor